MREKKKPIFLCKGLQDPVKEKHLLIELKKKIPITKKNETVFLSFIWKKIFIFKQKITYSVDRKIAVPIKIKKGFYKSFYF